MRNFATLAFAGLIRHPLPRQRRQRLPQEEVRLCRPEPRSPRCAPAPAKVKMRPRPATRRSATVKKAAPVACAPVTYAPTAYAYAPMTYAAPAGPPTQAPMGTPRLPAKSM